MTFTDFMERLEQIPPYRTARLRDRWEPKEKHHREHSVSLLTALLIRRLNADGSGGMKTLAKRFNISPHTVGGILRGESFRDLPGLKDEYVFEADSYRMLMEAWELQAEMLARYGQSQDEHDIEEAKAKFNEVKKWLSKNY